MTVLLTVVCLANSSQHCSIAMQTKKNSLVKSATALVSLLVTLFKNQCCQLNIFGGKNSNFEFCSLTQILREINSDEFRDSKVDILTYLGAFTIFVKTW